MSQIANWLYLYPIDLVCFKYNVQVCLPVCLLLILGIYFFDFLQMTQFPVLVGKLLEIGDFHHRVNHHPGDDFQS